MGIETVLAGRNAEPLAALATELGMEARVFDLADEAQVAKALQTSAGVAAAQTTDSKNSCGAGSAGLINLDVLAPD